MAGVDHLLQIDAGRDAQALHHVEHIFTGDIAGCPLGIWAAPESCHRGMENRDAAFERGVDIGQRLPVGVMKMSRQALDREFVDGALHDRMHLSRRGNTDRVGDVDFIAAQIAQTAHHIGHRRRLDPALIRTAERATYRTAQ